MADSSREALQSDELQLDLYSIIRALLKDWWMILTAGMVGIFCAYIMAGTAYVPVYTTSMTFIVSSKGSTSSASSLTATAEMADTFSQVLNSRLLKKKVQQELGLSYLPGTIETNVVSGTNLMTLKVSASSPEHSFKIMKSVLDNYSEITDYVLSNVVLDVLEAPTVPKAPSNPISAQDMMKKYAMIGMAAMAALLAVISYLKDDVKNEKEVERKLDTALFATVYHEVKNKTLKSKIRRTKKGLLVSDPTCSFLFVETYKKIRTKLMYKAGNQKGQVILVTSVLENEGKSTVAANIALTLAQKSDHVVFIDGDLRRPAAYKILQKELEESREIGSYLNEKSDFEQVMQWDEENRLYLLIGSKKYSNSTELVSGERMQELMEEVRAEADYVVIDSPPTSMMADAEVLAEYADVSLLVVHQGMARTREINDTIDILENGGSELLGCIYNDVKTGVSKGKKSWGDYSYGGYRKYKRGYGYGYGRYGYGKAEKSEKKKDGLQMTAQEPKEEMEIIEMDLQEQETVSDSVEE